TRATAKGDIYGSHANTSVKGLEATARGTGRSFSLMVPVGPRHGELGVYLGSTLIKTIDEYAATGGQRLVPLYSTSAPAARAFTLRALGTKNKASGGVTVSVDALYPYYNAS
ncbi:hypothetical protein, partial [Jatrophihabitans endophyticus]|uniref:hypothetical protein n=1 Tax=Jatrophihabitans endophyticus TaxID=1206085 RepID=UPI0019E21C28